MEIWKDIEGYEGYQVSNEGRVKSLNYKRTKQEKILKGNNIGLGYFQVKLYKDGKYEMKLVHRLVAETFLENPNHYDQVNHKDENKENNCVDNLEWCDRDYNCNYGTRNQKIGESSRKRCSKRVDQIDPQTGEVICQWDSVNECGRNGYSQANVSKCARGLQKEHKGYIWKYPM